MHGKAFPQDSLEGRSFLSTYIRNSFSLLKHGYENKEAIYNFEPETLRKITNNKNIKKQCRRMCTYKGCLPDGVLNNCTELMVAN